MKKNYEYKMEFLKAELIVAALASLLVFSLKLIFPIISGYYFLFGAFYILSSTFFYVLLINQMLKQGSGLLTKLLLLNVKLILLLSFVFLVARFSKFAILESIAGLLCFIPAAFFVAIKQRNHNQKIL